MSKRWGSLKPQGCTRAHAIHVVTASALIPCPQASAHANTRAGREPSYAGEGQKGFLPALLVVQCLSRWVSGFLPGATHCRLAPDSSLSFCSPVILFLSFFTFFTLTINSLGLPSPHRGRDDNLFLKEMARTPEGSFPPKRK